jgi:hypothetical protein
MIDKHRKKLISLTAHKRNLGFLLKVIIGEINKSTDKPITKHFYKMKAQTEDRYATIKMEIAELKIILKDKPND